MESHTYSNREMSAKWRCHETYCFSYETVRQEVEVVSVFLANGSRTCHIFRVNVIRSFLWLKIEDLDTADHSPLVVYGIEVSNFGGTPADSST